MPNPTGINQYTGGGGPGINAHPDHGHGEAKPTATGSHAGNAHPDHPGGLSSHEQAKFAEQRNAGRRDAAARGETRAQQAMRRLNDRVAADKK